MFYYEFWRTRLTWYLQLEIEKEETKIRLRTFQGDFSIKIKKQNGKNSIKLIYENFKAKITIIQRKNL